MNKTKNLTKPFLLILVFLVLFACYLIFKPFLTEIFVAVILVSIFYRPYEYLVKKFKGRKNLTAFLMCLVLVLIIVLPTIRGIIYASQKSAIAYSQAVSFFNNNDINEIFKQDSLQSGALKYLNIDDLILQNEQVKGVVLDVLKKSSNWLISSATALVKGTTSFILSLILIIISMFFFFVDGKKMAHSLMRLSPLPDKYDREIFSKFRRVSYTTFISTFVVATAQGVVGAIGFAIIGFPPLLAGVIVGLLSLIPYVGSMIFYVPLGAYYILIGNVWQGVFILSWGFFFIGTIDDFLRAYLIKGKAEVNMIFVLFSILGGVSLFGFWGLVLGPLIISLAVTVLYIYELEFCDHLDDCIEEGALPNGGNSKRLRPDKFNLDRVDNDIVRKTLKFFKKKKKK